MTDILKRIGDKASEVVNTLKSIPPGENEKKGLEAIQDNVNSATADTKPSVAPEGAPAEQDKVSPLSRYGSRPGEKRIDTRKMLKPLGSSVPSYDEGTDRVPEDQLAMVHKDEAVLPPDEAEKYRAEHTDTATTPTETAKVEPVGKEEAAPKLRPYSEVLEEKAKQKAAEQVSSPGAQTTTSDVAAPAEGGAQPVPEEKPKLTYGNILAENWLKSKGINVPQAPTTTSDVAGKIPEPSAGYKPMQIPPDQVQQTAGGPLTTSAPTSETPREQRDLAGMERKAKLADFDKQHQTLLEKAAETNDPQYTEQAARVTEAKLAYEKANPWGSAGNHPGILGKLGHIAERVAARTPGLAPIVATIPGSEIDLGQAAKGAREDVKEANAQNVAENKPASIPGYKQVTGGAVDPKAVGTDLEDVPQVAFVNEKDPKQMIFAGPVTPKAGAGGDKAAFEKTLAKIGTADVADPTKQRAAIDAAHTAKKISDEEYANANAYLGSTSNAPGTQANAAQTKEDQKIAAGFRGKVLVFQNPDGSRTGMSYAQAKAEGRDLNGAMVYAPMAADKLRTAEKSYQNAMQMFGQYEKDINKSTLTEDDAHAMQVLTSHLDENPDMAMKFANDLLNALPDISGTKGTPLTNEQLAVQSGRMTKAQWDTLSPAGRERVADYFQAMLSHFQSIKDTQGSIPRNPEMIRTEMGAIPLPYLSKEEAAPAFEKYFTRMHNMNVDAVRFGQPEPPKETAAPTAPAGTTDEVVKDGKVIGHVVVENGKKVFKALQQ